MSDFADFRAGRGKPSSPWCRWCYRILARPGMAWLVLGGSLVVTLLASFTAWQHLRSRDQARFLARTERFHESLLQELDRYIRLLYSSRALWAVHPPATAEEWRSYVHEVTSPKGFSELDAMGYIERVRAEQLSNVLELLRRNQFLKRSSPHPLHSQSSRDDHYLIKFLEPLQDKGQAASPDVCSIPDRRRNLERARDSGQPTFMSETPSSSISNSSEMVLILPVYSIGFQATNVALRRESLGGWVCAAFQLDALLDQVYRLFHEEVDVDIVEGGKLLATTRMRNGLACTAKTHAVGRRLERSTTLQCGDHIWTLNWRPGPEFRESSWFSAPGHISAATLGLTISLLLFGVAHSMASTQKRAQALAEEMTAKLRLQNDAMACAKHGIFILDAKLPGYPVIYANPAFERITGYSANRSAGEQTKLLLPDSFGTTGSTEVPSPWQAGSTDQAILREYNRNGNRSWAEFRLMPVLDKDGQRTQYLGIVEDVTERRRSSEQLRRAEQRCLASDEQLRRTQLQLIQAAKMESIGTLAAGVAHEVKNPLQTILTGVGYLKHTLTSPSASVSIALGDMRAAVQRADTIVRELLELSRNTPFELAEGRLNNVIERCLHLLNSELLASRTNVVCHLEPDLPSVRIDVNKMEQVFLNLCLNAIQAMNHGGGLTLTTRLGQFGQNFDLAGNLDAPFRTHDRLVIAEVKDNGPGIPCENLARIFDPFFTTKPAGKGTGLGLSIVKRIIDLHGGAIDIHNAAKGGVVVTIALRASA